jgi:hypothetical protein
MAARAARTGGARNMTTAKVRSPRPKPPIFVIRLRARAGDDDAIRELRAILKILLRRHRLKCIDVREEGAA